MSGSKLRKQCVAVPNSTVLVTCYHQPNMALHPDTGERKLVGHVFATVWDYDGGNFFPFIIIIITHIPVRKSRLGDPVSC
jgi:hypothetical protein